METTEKCGHCAAMSETGYCLAEKKSVGYFDAACKHFTPKGVAPEQPSGDKTLTKVCAKCGRALTLDLFRKHNKGKMGVAAVCNDCKAGATKKEEPAKKAPGKAAAEKTAPSPATLHDYDDADLIAELAQRGWKGSVYKVTKLEVTL